MSVADAVRKNLSLRISLTLAVVLVLLTTVAATFITVRQTKQMQDLTLDKARLASASGARQYGDILDAAIDSGALTVADVFDRNYQEIKGYTWKPGPEKFHTRYDFFTDRAVLIFQDKLLDDPDFVFAVGVDENGYCPTHNTPFQKPLTGILEQDLAGNRTKRMFNNQVALAAAKNTTPGLLQIYTRDTGESTWDVATPIYVKGRFWGNFRIAVSMERLDRRKRELLLELVGGFVGFALVSIGTMFLLVRRAIRPVADLIAAADQISMGEALDVPIRSESVDEIGRLTKTIDRLRVSMKAAMSRLGE